MNYFDCMCHLVLVSIYYSALAYQCIDNSTVTRNLNNCIQTAISVYSVQYTNVVYTIHCISVLYTDIPEISRGRVRAVRDLDTSLGQTGGSDVFTAQSARNFMFAVSELETKIKKWAGLGTFPDDGRIN